MFTKIDEGLDGIRNLFIDHGCLSTLIVAVLVLSYTIAILELETTLHLPFLPVPNSRGILLLLSTIAPSSASTRTKDAYCPNSCPA